MVKLLDKDISTVSVPVFHMREKLEERLSLLNRDMEDINKTQMKLRDETGKEGGK